MNRNTNVLKSEPALVVGTFTAFLTELFGLLIAFNIDISDAQQNAVVATVTSAAALIVVMSGIIRQLVYSPESTNKLVDAAHKTGEKGEEPPVPQV